MKNNKLIYLACPYSHKDKHIQLQRFNSVNFAAAKLMKENLTIFSPISMSHPIAEHGLPTNWEYWKEFDEVFLSLSEKLIVLKLPGWTKSKGVAGEIKIAKNLNIPIEYLEKDFAE